MPQSFRVDIGFGLVFCKKSQTIMPFYKGSLGLQRLLWPNKETGLQSSFGSYIEVNQNNLLPFMIILSNMFSEKPLRVKRVDMQEDMMACIYF